MQNFKNLSGNLYDSEEDLKTKLLTAILFFIMLATIVSSVPMIVGKMENWWINLLLFGLTLICQFLNLKFHKGNIASILLAAVFMLILLPVMYFLQGGVKSGMPLWMLLALLICFMMLEGMSKYVLVALGIIISCGCFIVEYLHPEYVVSLANRTVIFQDIIISFILAPLIFIIILDVHLKAYSHKRELLEYASEFDALTGVKNRYAYERFIQTLDKKSLDDDLIIISADVNGLKVVNDTNGHSAGDELLIGAAQVLDETFGKMGKVFRTGGDEFQVIINTDSELYKLQRDFDANMKKWKGKKVDELHISIGYALSKDNKGKTFAGLTQKADKQMYRNKQDYYQKINKTKK